MWGPGSRCKLGRWTTAACEPGEEGAADLACALAVRVPAFEMPAFSALQVSRLGLTESALCAERGERLTKRVGK